MSLVRRQLSDITGHYVLRARSLPTVERKEYLFDKILTKFTQRTEYQWLSSLNENYTHKAF